MDQPRINLPSLLEQSFGLCISPQDLLLPYYNIPSINYYRPWKWYNMQTSKDLGSTISDEKDKFKICLDVQHFQPSEINVKVTDTEVIIEGNHEERKDNHGFISRRFKRRYLLPKNSDSNSVVSSISSDGVLIVTVDKATHEEKKEIIVPIKMCPKDSIKDEAKTEANAAKSKPVEPIKEMAEVKAVDTKADKKKTTTIMLREDHSRLLKPELLGEAASAVLEKKEFEVSVAGVTDSLSANTEFCSKISTQSGKKTKETCRETEEKPSSTMVETRESIAGASSQTQTSSQSHSIQNVVSETTEIEQGSSSFSSSLASMKDTTAKINDLLSMNNKVSSKVSAQSGTKTEEKCELIEDESSSAMFETTKSIAGASRQTEPYFITSIDSETTEIEQASSSYSSSMASSFKETTAKINELVSDISAQLKEAAENI